MLQSGETAVSDSNTWKNAVEMARCRGERREQALDTTVRSLASAFGCSHGRAADLLRIYGAFGGRELILLGWGDADEGEELLSRLTYRQFRKLLAVNNWMTMTRVTAVWDMLDIDLPWARTPSAPERRV